MNLQQVGKLFVGIGAFLVLFGILLVISSKLGFFKFGRIPGDISVSKNGFNFYFPIATSIILSIVLTLVLWLVSALITGTRK